MQHATRRANNSDRHLRLVTDTDPQARADTEPKQTRAKPALAVWRLEHTSTRALPAELARQLIAHYTDRGDLVLAPRPGCSDALRQATRLGRRALAFDARKRHAGKAAHAEGVVALRPNERADLAIAAPNANASERHATELAASLLARLKPGAYLVLIPGDARGGLGAIVHVCQDMGLQYWQHVIALDPAPAVSKGGARLKKEQGQQVEPVGRRAIRCHRDLLVFRRPANARAVAAAAAAIGKVAA